MSFNEALSALMVAPEDGYKMEIDIGLLGGKNITLVYDVLPLERIDRNELKRIVGDPQLVVLDVPDEIVAIAQTKRVLLRIGGQRMRITDQNSEPFGSTELASLAVDLHRMTSESSLVAYGFNYDVGLGAQNQSLLIRTLKDRFLPDEKGIAAIVGGEIDVIAPRLVFHRGDVRCDLVFFPEDSSLKAHLNVHFASNCLPDASSLGTSLDQEFQLLGTLLRNLFERTPHVY